MSGFVSALTNGAEAVSGIISLAFGATGGVVLGDAVFAGFEVPEHITFGGEQKMTIHTMPGGERVFDMLGPSEGDISWSGMFLDGNPHGRAQQLDQMRVRGEPLPLVWGTFFYTVVIRSFSADTQYSRAPYRITCAVIRNEAAAASSVDPDLTSSVGNDVLSAVAAAPASLASTMASAQSAVSILGTLIPGSPSLAVATAQIGAASGALSSLGISSGVGIGAVTDGASLASITANAGGMAQSLRALPYLGRALGNLA